MKFKFFVHSIFAVALMLVINSCKKSTDVVVPPVEAHFNSTDGSYYIQNSASSVFNVPIGLTAVSNADTKVTVSVSSPTGAAAGSQYTIASTTVTIPAGKAVADLPVKGLFAGYATGRKDTLVFTITGGDVAALDGNTTYTLVLQKYCDVDLNNLEGDYLNSVDSQTPDSYGPYTCSVSAVSTGPTSATLTIQNFSGAAFGPFGSSDASANPGIKVNIDWSNPANFTTTIPQQSFYTDATYGPATIKPVGSGTFSSCDNTITVSYTVTVAAGSFGNFVTTLKR